jgi:hypothetical protein
MGRKFKFDSPTPPHPAFDGGETTEERWDNDDEAFLFEQRAKFPSSNLGQEDPMAARVLGLLGDDEEKSEEALFETTDAAVEAESGGRARIRGMSGFVTGRVEEAGLVRPPRKIRPSVRTRFAPVEEPDKGRGVAVRPGPGATDRWASHPDDESPRSGKEE